MKYDYLIVGAGLFGATFAERACAAGKTCLVIDKRDKIGGNVYTKNVDGINVHVYGAHIFHTSDKEVWDYINRFAEFNDFINSPVADYYGERYNLPFNMNTFHQMWGVTTEKEAKEKISSQTMGYTPQTAKNLEEKAISLVGEDVYRKLVKGYTEKQWGRSCRELPAFIIERLPLRFTYDNNYFNDVYQGIPKGGYTAITEKMLSASTVLLSTDYKKFVAENGRVADKVIYTGAIDEYFDFKLGALEYRSLNFETERLEIPDYQGNAVVNYTDEKTAYTRVIEHKHFEYGTQPFTVITREYPATYALGKERFYPVNNEKNNALYEKYRGLSDSEENVYFCGRLGEYKYYDMDKTIAKALALAKQLI